MNSLGWGDSSGQCDQLHIQSLVFYSNYFKLFSSPNIVLLRLTASFSPLQQMAISEALVFKWGGQSLWELLCPFYWTFKHYFSLTQLKRKIEGRTSFLFHWLLKHNSTQELYRFSPTIQAPQLWQGIWWKLSSRVHTRMQLSMAEAAKEWVHKRLKLSPEGRPSQGRPVSYGIISLSCRANVTCFWKELLRQRVQISHKPFAHFQKTQKGIRT